MSNDPAPSQVWPYLFFLGSAASPAFFVIFLQMRCPMPSDAASFPLIP